MSGISFLILPILIISRLVLLLLGDTLMKAGSWKVENDRQDNEEKPWPHSLASLSDDTLTAISNLLPQTYTEFNSTLDGILIQREPGTESHRQVQEFIIKEMQDLDWNVEVNRFEDRTPFGVKPFANIISTLNPQACRRLVLACHYDSLGSREGDFVGAIDSAVPCTMMILFAKVLDNLLKQQRTSNNDITLQYIFFDGEEAFKKWTATDSLYGSRHLATKWNTAKFMRSAQLSHCSEGDFESELDRMDVMVLLDLIGSPNPIFHNYFLETSELYGALVKIEQRLNDIKLMETTPAFPETKYFDPKAVYMGFIDDDHVPFMKKGVPIVHLIPSPFPSVWHSSQDDRAHLHHPTINNLNKVLIAFLVQYLHLNPDGRP